MQFIVEKKPRISFSLENKIEITFETEKSNLSQIQSLKDEKMVIEIKKFRNKRSISQNAYLWVLLDEIGKKVGKSKEQIYKEYIKDYGVFETIPIKKDAVERFTKSWAKNGLGWCCQSLGERKFKGYDVILAYYGTSSYDSKEMSRILDAVILDCEELGINAMPLQDIMLLRNENDEK